jgi:alkylation response protein AidB-like acyl-CoA dehydrogenase
MTHHSFHGGMALAMLAYSASEGTTTFDKDNGHLASTRFASAIKEIGAGDAWGCMDITEPNAGSDMAALRTVAEQDPDGQWYLTGQKIFISSGHAKYHFVIARSERSSSPEDPQAGLSGLSMFLVHGYEDLPDGKRQRFVTMERVEEKLGHHGSVTAALSFERAPAQLIGKRGEGFQYMLTLMNNARLGVGFECLGLCEAAHRLATAYAQDRVSMGKPIARHELVADYLDEMQTDIQGVRALAVHGAFHEEMAQKLNMMMRLPGAVGEAEKLAKRLSYHRAQARRATPLLKYLAAEKAVELTRRCIQIHGGVGYTRDYGAERLLRDAVVMPIYEGTSQIQSLMAMKDTLLGIFRRPQGFLARTAQARWRSVSARDELDRRVARLQSLSAAAQQHLLTRTAAGKLRALSGVAITKWPRALQKSWDPKRDFALAMLHAERLTRLLADEHIAELLLAQAQSHPDRRELLERWLERAEPRCRLLHQEITCTGDRLLRTLAAGSDSGRAAS